MPALEQTRRLERARQQYENMLLSGGNVTLDEVTAQRSLAFSSSSSRSFGNETVNLSTPVRSAIKCKREDFLMFSKQDLIKLSHLPPSVRPVDPPSAAKLATTDYTMTDTDRDSIIITLQV